MFYESEGPWAYYGGFFPVFTNKNFRGPGQLSDSSPTLRLLPYGQVGNIPILTIIPVVTTWGCRPASLFPKDFHQQVRAAIHHLVEPG